MESVKEVNQSSYLFNIQRFSLHDGPGIRTVIFLKGCPMRCLWCSNPESQSYNLEIADIPNNCIECGHCKDICPENGIIRLENGKYAINKEKCIACGKCTEVCKARSKYKVGYYMEVDEVIDLVNRDRTYYKNSGGGVTLSGGEPLSHHKFVNEFLTKAKDNMLNTAVETCGYFNYEKVSDVIDKLDLIIFDLKIFNEQDHKKNTNKSNVRILENLENLSKHDVEILIRIPIIPGYTDSKENINSIINHIKDIKNINKVEILAYHNYGAHKYPMVDKKYKLNHLETPSDEAMINIKKYINGLLEGSNKVCLFNE